MPECTVDRMEQCKVMNASEKISQCKSFLRRYILHAQGSVGPLLILGSNASIYIASWGIEYFYVFK